MVSWWGEGKGIRRLFPKSPGYTESACANRPARGDIQRRVIHLSSYRKLSYNYLMGRKGWVWNAGNSLKHILVLLCQVMTGNEQLLEQSNVGTNFSGIKVWVIRPGNPDQKCWLRGA